MSIYVINSRVNFFFWFENLLADTDISPHAHINEMEYFLGPCWINSDRVSAVYSVHCQHLRDQKRSNRKKNIKAWEWIATLFNSRLIQVAFILEHIVQTPSLNCVLLFCNEKCEGFFFFKMIDAASILIWCYLFVFMFLRGLE